MLRWYKAVKINIKCTNFDEISKMWAAEFQYARLQIIKDLGLAIMGNSLFL